MGCCIIGDAPGAGRFRDGCVFCMLLCMIVEYSVIMCRFSSYALGIDLSAADLVFIARTLCVIMRRL